MEHNELRNLRERTERRVRKIINWHEKQRNSRTFGQRVADTLAAASGSWWFVIAHIIWFFMWIYFAVEPFPYGLLTMIVSLEAIFLSTFILISQNRQSERDRVQAQNDFETNLAAKEEIEQLMLRLDSIEKDKLDKILALMERRQ